MECYICICQATNTTPCSKYSVGPTVEYIHAFLGYLYFNLRLHSGLGFGFGFELELASVSILQFGYINHALLKANYLCIQMWSYVC